MEAKTPRISHGALAYFSMDLVGGPRRAQEFLHVLPRNIQVSSISSIYKRFQSLEQVDLNARMEFVTKIITDLSPEELLGSLAQLTEKIQVILLAYDDLILMSPQMTLPYPDLHNDPLVIRCSAEAWGEYEHPVYQKTLSEISRTALPSSNSEFFLQGRSLIDI